MVSRLRVELQMHSMLVRPGVHSAAWLVARNCLFNYACASGAGEGAGSIQTLKQSIAHKLAF
eukprot:2188715-Alexandrium_andersonii.AAC.1